VQSEPSSMKWLGQDVQASGPGADGEKKKRKMWENLVKMKNLWEKGKFVVNKRARIEFLKLSG
jgi:hypothetical protein